LAQTSYANLGKPVQKDKTSLDFNEAKDDRVLGWQRHQLDHMQNCIQYVPRSRQITKPTSHHSVLNFAMPNREQQSTKGNEEDYSVPKKSWFT